MISHERKLELMRAARHNIILGRKYWFGTTVTEEEVDWLDKHIDEILDSAVAALEQPQTTEETNAK